MTPVEENLGSRDLQPVGRARRADGSAAFLGRLVQRDHRLHGGPEHCIVVVVSLADADALLVAIAE